MTPDELRQEFLEDLKHEELLHSDEEYMLKYSINYSECDRLLAELNEAKMKLSKELLEYGHDYSDNHISYLLGEI
jgi:hypothetical protein